MKKILLTTFIALGFGFGAMAQQEPVNAKTAKKSLSTPKAERLQEQAKLQKFKMDADKAAQQTPATKTKAALIADKASDAVKN